MRASAGRIFVIASTLLVVTVVAVGVFLTGSPMQARVQSLDTERVRSLMNLSGAIERYHDDRHALPRSLDELAAAQPGLAPADLRDPQTGAQYEYLPTGKDTYRLCAVFGMPSEPEGEVFWRHARGRNCFDFEAPEPAQPPSLAPAKAPFP